MPMVLATKCPHLSRRNKAFGFCESCYNRFRKHGSIEPRTGKGRRTGGPPESAECHPDRPQHARGLCDSCYTLWIRRGKRNLVGARTLGKRSFRYLDSLLEELEFAIMDWDKIEEITDRSRQTVAAALYRRGERDLVRRIHTVTYGGQGYLDRINSGRGGEKNVKNYYEELQVFLEYDADLRWVEVLNEFSGKTYEQLRGTLRYHGRHDLISRLDKNSGLTQSEPYGERLLRVVETDPEVTWEMLSILFGGRTAVQISRTLYRFGHIDRVRIINKASMKGI